MSKNERFIQILKLLDQYDYMTVEDLCKRLYVSPSTLRRDLSQMSRRGYVTRTRGGAAALTSGDANENIVHQRTTQSLPAHRAIAERAATFVKDGDLIFLDSSHLTLCMSEFLRTKRHLTIVTNSLQLILALPEGRHQIICCGGRLNASNLSVMGENTIAIAASFNYAGAFFSCAGLADGYTSTRSLGTSTLLKVVSSYAERRHLLCTQDKIGMKAPIKAVDVNHLTSVITDAEENRLTAQGVRTQIITVTS